MKYLFTIFLLFFFISFSLASNSDIKVKSYRLEKPLKIDGKITESAYENEPIKNFIQKEPVEGEPVTEKTHMWVFHDDSNIYFCGRFYDSQPDSIDRTLMRRDNISESDWFFIYLDPYHDGRTGNYLAINPGGSIADGTLFNDGWMDENWNGVFEARTNVDELGWSAEIRVPFTQFRFNEAEKMVWGINLNRDIKRKHEMSFLVMIPPDESGFVSRFADLEGLDGIKSKQRIEVLPYIVQKAQYLRDNDGPFYKGNQYKTSFGADLKMSVGSNLNFDATFNPDFGQVEVDPAILNLSAFENFFDEKRPFFIEGSNIFQFGVGGANNNWGFNFSNPQLFYSRRIGRTPQGSLSQEGFNDSPNETRILEAAKLTGKFDESWSIGALSALTERTYASIHLGDAGSIEEEIEPVTHYGVLRTRKEFNSGKQSIGMIFTSVNRDLRTSELKDRLSKSAYTFGIDGWTFLDSTETYVITGSVIGSYTQGTKNYLLNLQQQPYRYFQRPDKTFMGLDSNRTSLSGVFSRIMLNKQKGNFYINAAIGTASPGFEYNDLGSQWFADRINGHLVAGYRWFDPDNYSRRKSIYIAYNRNSDYEDNVSRAGFFNSSSIQFLNYWGIGMNANYNFESTSTTLTRGGPKIIIPANYSIFMHMYTDSREKIILTPYGGFWRNELGSNDYEIGIDIEWKPIPTVNLTIGPEYEISKSVFQWVGKFEGVNANSTFGTRYVFATLDQKTFSANIRLNWTFNPELSLQLYLQPFFSVGNYFAFKELAEPNTTDFNLYGNNSSSIEFIADSAKYFVDPDGNGPAEQFSFGDPNFNFKSLRGNVVLRWEVLPGSVLFLVWSHEKTNSSNPGRFNLSRDFRTLWRSEPNNVFLLKFSYWWDI